jgi:ATP-dependent Clp protease ATP-binding subunit ClpC
VFRALTKKDVSKILELQLDELRSRLVKHGLALELTTKAKNYLLKHGYDAHNGARPMRRLIQETLEDNIALELLENNYHKGSIVQVDADAKKLLYSGVTETSPAAV